MWLNAIEPNCIKFSAENNGWLILDGFLKPTLFVGDATPVEIESVILHNSQDESADKEDKIDSSNDSESSEESNFY